MLLGARVGQLRAPVGKPALLAALRADFKGLARTSRVIAMKNPISPPPPTASPPRKTLGVRSCIQPNPWDAMRSQLSTLLPKVWIAA